MGSNYVGVSEIFPGISLQLHELLHYCLTAVYTICFISLSHPHITYIGRLSLTSGFIVQLVEDLHSDTTLISNKASMPLIIGFKLNMN